MASVHVWRQSATPSWPELAIGAGVLAAVAGLTLAPLATVLFVLAAGGVAVLVRRPFVVTLALIVLMGNVKANYYVGFFTLFPEYVVLMFAAAIGFTAWLGRRQWPADHHAMLLFGVWMFTGLLSVPFAMSASKVLGRVILMGFSLATMMAVVATVDTRGRLTRAIAVWEVSATLYASYGIVQMVALMAGFDVTPHFLEGIANPDMYLGVGSPVRRRIGDVFRANAMFNDPNILAGFLAAAMVAILALRMHHASQGRRHRAAAEQLALWIMGIALLLTQSRSGFLALFAGAALVYRHRARSFLSSGVLVTIGVGVFAMIAVTMLIGIDPTLLASRFVDISNTNDTSNRQHLDVFVYGLDLIRRYPLTGVGLGNFGFFYGAERDAWFANMMSHCAPLSAFAESGLPGGIAFLAFWTSLLQRLRRVRPEPADAQGETIRVALLASLVALLVANLFYDYLLRTFVWVIVGLAIAMLRLIPGEQSTRAGA